MTTNPTPSSGDRDDETNDDLGGSGLSEDAATDESAPGAQPEADNAAEEDMLKTLDPNAPPA